MSKGDKLTAKQEMFCKEYLLDLNATQAAIRAGYSEKTAQKIGSENFLKPVIQSRITELKADRENRLEINADWVLSQAVKIHELCLTEEKYDASNALKALDTVGKHVNIRAFIDRQEVEHKGGIDQRITKAREKRLGFKSKAQ